MSAVKIRLPEQKKLSFKWKPGGLRRIEARRVEHGWVVLVATSDATEGDHEYACADWAEALLVMGDCFAWDTSEAKEAAKPVEIVGPGFRQFPKFPDTFVRFDIDGDYVTAVFREWGVECRRTVTVLSRHIQWLSDIIGLDVAERGPWFAVLIELRAKSAAALAKEGAGA